MYCVGRKDNTASRAILTVSKWLLRPLRRHNLFAKLTITLGLTFTSRERY